MFASNPPLEYGATGYLLHWRFNRDVARIGVLYFPHGIIKLVRARANLVRRQSCLPIHQDRAPERQLLLEPRQIRLLANLTRGDNNHLLPWVIVITCSVTGIGLALERDCSKTFKSCLSGPDSARKGILVYPAVPLKPCLVLAHPCPLAYPQHFSCRLTSDVVQDPPFSIGRNELSCLTNDTNSPRVGDMNAGCDRGFASVGSTPYLKLLECGLNFGSAVSRHG